MMLIWVLCCFCGVYGDDFTDRFLELFGTSQEVLEYGNQECNCVPNFDCENGFKINGVKFERKAGVRCSFEDDVCCGPVPEPIPKTGNAEDLDFDEDTLPISVFATDYVPEYDEMTDSVADTTTILTDDENLGAVEAGASVVKNKRENGEVDEIPSMVEIRSCGQRNPDGVKVLQDIEIPDGETRFGEYPWTIAILKEQIVAKTTVKIFYCGGSLIHPNVVLTAAHCVHEEGVYVARAGDWDILDTAPEPLEARESQVAEKIIHPKFHIRNPRNDIALLFLNNSIELDEHINTVCLPRQGEKRTEGSCIVTGWGKNSESDSYQNVMKSIELPVVLNKECERIFREKVFGKRFKLHKMMCAGGEKGIDTCKGDGGSPLVCPESIDERYAQYGIVSFGKGCGGDTPAVYTHVASYRLWIDEQMEKKDLNQSYYQFVNTTAVPDIDQFLLQLTPQK